MSTPINHGALWHDPKSGTALCDASDAGLSPGNWPAEISTGGIVYTRVHFEQAPDGELRWVDYNSNVCGRMIRIFND